MAENLVDRAKLDAALTATANAIRAKGGGSPSIPFDMDGETGFMIAVASIPQGGGGDEVDLYAGKTEPSGAEDGDLWVDTSDEHGGGGGIILNVQPSGSIVVPFRGSSDVGTLPEGIVRNVQCAAQIVEE